jgi:HAE1 family hydrophobic/amphiphilic exporter-1/multidrug efflux pump
MNEIKTKVLDDTFTTDLGGESRDFVEQLEYLPLLWTCTITNILILAAQFESFIDPFIIILTVPMVAAGFIFRLFDQTWNIFRLEPLCLLD